MDWVAIGAIAALISALAAALTTWVAYCEYQDKKNTGQPRSPRRSAPPSVPTQPQPRQAGFLSSNVARRSLLLGSTALGLVSILSEIPKYSLSLFLFVNIIVLVGGICVWRGRVQRIAVWRGAILKYGGVVGLVWWWYWVLWFCDIGLGSVWFVSEFGGLVSGLIIYLTSIYIGRW